MALLSCTINVQDGEGQEPTVLYEVPLTKLLTTSQRLLIVLSTGLALSYNVHPAFYAQLQSMAALPLEFYPIASSELEYSREEFSKLRIFDYEAVETEDEVINATIINQFAREQRLC